MLAGYSALLTLKASQSVCPSQSPKELCLVLSMLVPDLIFSFNCVQFLLIFFFFLRIDLALCSLVRRSNSLGFIVILWRPMPYSRWFQAVYSNGTLP